MKKYLPIILIAIGVVAIIMIGIFGAAIIVQDETVLVSSIEFTNADINENNITALDYDTTQEYQLEWAITPEDATNKDVEFISNNENVTVSETGLVTFTSSDEGATITIKAKDASNKAASVTIIPQTSETINTSYDPEAQTLTIPADSGIVNEETDEIILFEGLDYVLSAGDATLNIEGVISETDSNGKLIFGGTGTGNLHFNRNGETHTYTYTVVPFASSFGEGNALTLYASNKAAQDAEGVNIYADNSTVYTVGYSNGYQIDLSIVSYMLNDISTTLDLTYEIAEYDAVGEAWEAYASIDDVAYAALDSNEDLLFTSAAADGSNYKVKVSATYQPDKFVEQTVTVTEGTNVYNHAELKAAYADLNVHNIILHANIVAQLDANQVYNDADVDAMIANTESNVTEEHRANIVGTPKNLHYVNGQAAGDVYVRYTNGTLAADNDIKINGNNYTVTAQDLPLSVIDANATKQTYSTLIAGDPIDVNIAIFRLVNEQATYAVTMDLDNVSILGNAVRSDDTLTAGGYIGVKGQSTEVDFSNTAVRACLLGFVPDGMPTTTATNTITNSYFKDFYTTSVFVWGSKVEITDSYLRKAGGPLIMVIDSNAAEGTASGQSGDTLGNDPEVIITNSNIENWVSGEEAWFIDYGLNAAVPGITGSGEAGANMMGQTINNTIEEITYFNLIICLQNTDPVLGGSNTHPQGKITIDGATAYYPYGLSTDADPTNDMVPVDIATWMANSQSPAYAGDYTVMYTSDLGTQLGLVLGWTPNV